MLSAKIFAENELNMIISSQPNLILNKNKIETVKKQFSNTFNHVCLGISASGPTKDGL